MIKIAINQEHKNKMPKLASHQMKDWWRIFNGQFKNFDLPSVDPLVWAITNGYSVTSQHSGYRKRDNFICGQHIGLDFDTGDVQSSIERLSQRDFIQRNAALIHTTASHTEDNPRARVLFILERPIYSRRKYSILTEAFADAFTDRGADQSCKDPVRLFFGAEGCEVLRLNNVLTFNRANEIVAPYKEKQAKRTQSTGIRPSSIGGDASWRINNQLTKLAMAPDGEKWFTLTKVSRTVGGYVGAGYIDESDAFSQLSQAIAGRAEDMSIATDTVKWGLRIGKEEPIYLDEDVDPILRSVFT